jgi:hypothetical protein
MPVNNELPHKHELTRKAIQQKIDHTVEREGGGYNGPTPPPYIVMWTCKCGYKVPYDFMTLDEINNIKKGESWGKKDL